MAKSKPVFTVLFVCMGNICRSPTAHGVFRDKVAAAGLQHQVVVDSAGTHNHHPGEAPDRRSQLHARKRNYDLSDLRARQIHRHDFVEADLILAMDWDNLALIEQLCPPAHAHKLRRFTEFCQVLHSEVVPDPYYGGDQGFEEVLDLVEDASAGLLAHVRAAVGKNSGQAVPAALPCPSAGEPASPCVGVCQLDPRQTHCLGCKRTLREIEAWPFASNEQRRSILQRLAASRS